MRILTPLGRIVLELAGLAGGLGLLLLVIATLAPQLAGAAPLGQTVRPGQGPFGTTEQNNCRAAMAAQGYYVDAVGRPLDPGGSPSRTTVVMVMPLQSPHFDPDRPPVQDPEMRKQVLAGLVACHRFYPTLTQIGIGLQWGSYTLLFPSTAAAIDQAISPDALWTQVSNAGVMIATATGRAVQSGQFLYKDFSGNRNAARGLPPAPATSTSTGPQIRLEPATAYLPAGSTTTLLATVTDNSNQPLAGEVVTVTYGVQGQDDQPAGQGTTGPDGSVRIPFPAPAAAAGPVLVQASTALRPLGAAALLTLGLADTAVAPDAVAESLRAAGYNVLGVQPPSGSTPPQAAAEIVAPRLDRAARSEVLRLAGTLLTMYPQAAQAVPILLYRNEDAVYQLQFQLQRSDWTAWLAGSLTEAGLWQRLPLARVVDTRTGQPVNQQNFIDKVFSGVTLPVPDIPVLHTVASTLTDEAWGPQVTSARFTVPTGGGADHFTVINRSDGANFALYGSADPATPLYQSSTDPQGAALGRLQLAAGEYLLVIESPGAPAQVRLTYIAHLFDSALTTP